VLISALAIRYVSYFDERGAAAGETAWSPKPGLRPTD
jgi:hypothetical protein